MITYIDPCILSVESLECANGKTPPEQFLTTSVNDGTKDASSRTKTILDPEQRDFEREYASLRER